MASSKFRKSKRNTLSLDEFNQTRTSRGGRGRGRGTLFKGSGFLESKSWPSGLAEGCRRGDRRRTFPQESGTSRYVKKEASPLTSSPESVSPPVILGTIPEQTGGGTEPTVVAEVKEIPVSLLRGRPEQGKLNEGEHEHLKEIARKLIDGPLQLDPSGWGIIDYDKDAALYLAHYNEGEEFDHERLGGIRGVIFDVEKQVPVCQSYGYTPTCLADEVIPDSKGDLTFTDQFGKVHEYNAGHYSIRVGYEGVILRAFKHKGKFYLSSHKKIRPYNSRWGPSRRFLDIYKSLGGPTPSDLFHKDTKCSPFCYIFIVVDPCLLVGSKQDVGKGYISYLGSMQMWTLGEGCPYSAEEMGHVEYEPRRLSTIHSSPTRVDSENSEKVIPISEIPKMTAEIGSYRRDMDSKPDENPLEGEWKTSPVLESVDLTITQANYHLRYGYYPPYDPDDKRLRLGEFLLIISNTALTSNPEDDGKEPDVLRIESTAFRHRNLIRNDKHTPLVRLFELITTTFIGNESKFDSQYARMPRVHDESISKHLRNGYLLAITSDTSRRRRKRNLVTILPQRKWSMNEQAERLRIVWLNFILSMPPQQQSEMADFPAELDRRINTVATGIVKIITGSIIIPGDIKIPPRVKMISDNSKRYSTTQGVSLHEAILSSVRRERGASLYGIHKFIIGVGGQTDKIRTVKDQSTS